MARTCHVANTGYVAIRAIWALFLQHHFAPVRQDHVRLQLWYEIDGYRDAFNDGDFGGTVTNRIFAPSK
ncbi:hypothetical protein Cob_v005998 [Colletotrichum orbiculare MAFF 240422]|uniref:Uncharacterized protein n=1 Tax=Colletotrichum orbiculare (strain 104-T / ATCC 96160 / CBS 514.97 / LARS 414 / MAFF 240422) TaxID=1213857 RepID=A0A484FUD1_COLOR|nr:hypothetical protein Cob_v005998 [Colletotrichum orbiculare MAFF 240422]